MATKTKNKKKRIGSSKAASRKAIPKKKAKKKTPVKRAPRKKARLKKRGTGPESQRVATEAFEPEGLRARSGGQAGDLQGLSDTAGVDSESVDELLEEGNAYEAEIVEGVQDAANADESEVVTHETPEDDVPEEDRDQEQ